MGKKHRTITSKHTTHTNTMPPLRPSASAASSLVRSAIASTTNTTTNSLAKTTTLPARRAALFSTTARRSAGAHGPQFDPPTGWLFGVKPGEKAEKEGWEGLLLYGFCGSMVVFTVAYAFKPDTS